jgi:hypothetical protein
MVELTESAQKGLNDYLRQVRAYLRWSKSLDRDEVEQNITDHIERELEGSPEPVSCNALEGVLARLGSPRQWVPPEALNWWGKVVLKLRTDSEDWRLAYISSSFLLVAVILMFLVSPLQVVFFAASFVTARAALAAAADEDLGAQKWLIYPALLIVSAAFAFFLFVGPGLLAGIIGGELYEVRWIRQGSAMGVVALVITSAALVTGLWWMLLGLILCKWPVLLRGPMRPFADGFNRRRALTLSSAGLLLLLLLAAFVALYMNDAFAIFME